MSGRRAPSRAVAAVALCAFVAALAALLAWRAGFGISFEDDAYYASAAVRFAQGARPFVDDLYLQSLGFLPTAPFLKLWMLAFGTTGVVYAFRLVYLLFAAVSGAIVYRALRPSFGSVASALAAAVPLLAPPYNLVAVSYNTLAMMGMLASCALAFAAVRDSSSRAAALAGVAAAVSVAAYPPFALCFLVLAVSVQLSGRDATVTRALVLGVAGAGAVLAISALLVAGVANLALTYDYARAVATSLSADIGPPIVRAAQQAYYGLLRRAVAPMVLWYLPAVAAVAASLARRTPHRLRTACVAALPVLVALPVLGRFLAGGDPAFTSTLGGNYLTSLTIFLIPATLGWARSEAGGDGARLLSLTAAPGVVGLVLVASLSNAGLFWASPFVGLAPLTAASIAVWAAFLRARSDRVTLLAASGTVVALVLAMLFSASFKDGRIADMSRRFDHGTLAGIATTPARGAEIDAVGALSARYVRPGARVLFAGMPLGYLVSEGVPLTDSVWIAGGPSGAETVRYFERRGEFPEVAFVTTKLMRAGDSGTAAGRDPLIDYLRRGYRTAETTAGLTVFVRR